VKVVVSWLREFCATELPAEEIAERIIAAGVHVEEIHRPWAGLSGVVAARVTEKRAHPNSDRLTLATLDTGSGTANVAAGVANWERGDLIPYAPPGARVPSLSEPLGVKTLRGETSEGMMCSPHELGISDDHGGILVLAPETPLGADVAALFGLDDAVLEIEIEPNRPDLMSVVGVAREVAAVTGAPLASPDVNVTESLEAAAGAATVEVLDRERCPRYLARVILGVSVGPSPIRVQARLFASGMRPISNVVDATNYVLLELGQPLHPFDLHRLNGEGIVVRRALEGERMVTLDDVERGLSTEDLVIADHGRAVAIAGVMGSADAEVAPDTQDVLLESAYFDPRGIIRTSRRLKLSTEASQRFERGTDPELPGPAGARAAGLIARWAGGRILGGVVDVGVAPERRTLAVRPSRVSFFLAQTLSAEDVRGAFDRLGMAATESGPDRLDVEVPGYRVDLDREVDLIEEVARVRGYSQLPSTLPPIKQAGALAPTYAFRRRVRDSLVRAGLRETASLSFGSGADLELAGHHEKEGVPVANPIDAERGFLRTSLVPGLVRALGLNLDRQRRSAAIFEIGHVFRLDGEVEETERAAAAMTGPAANGLTDPRREFDFFDAKGVLEAVMGTLGIRDWSLGDVCPWPMHPARSAAVLAGGEVVGRLGELHQGACRRAGLAGRVAVVDLDVDAVSRHARAETSVGEVPRFPPARRDLAFLVDVDTPVGRLEEVLRTAAGSSLDSVVLFDVHTGDPIPEGKKNVAFSVDFRAPDRTLTDAEVDGAVEAIRERVAAEAGGELRTG
jgi:phenylalanyl-tRNA synthetase beta chain